MVETYQARRCPHNRYADDACRDCTSDFIVEMSRDNKSVREMAAATGWSKTTVRRIRALRSGDICDLPS